MRLLFLLLLLGCKPKGFTEAEINLLLEDRENKQLELMYLEEIRQAQINNDHDAYEFYLEEYIKVPRLEIPEELKAHPKYFIGGQNINY